MKNYKKLLVFIIMLSFFLQALSIDEIIATDVAKVDPLKAVIEDTFNTFSESTALSELDTLMKETGQKIEYKTDIGMMYYNHSIYKRYGVVSYTEDPEEVIPEGVEPRYIGRNIQGELISNFLFPYDDIPPAGANFSNYKWIADPATKKRVRTGYPDVKSNYFDDIDSETKIKNNEQFLDSFLIGMELQHGDFYEEDKSVHWVDFFHVIVPPTEHTNGVARMWFDSISGGVRYIDVILLADIITKGVPELSIIYEGDDVTNNAGSPIQLLEMEPMDIKVTLKNKSTTKTESYNWYADGSLIGSTTSAADTISDIIPFGTTSRTYTLEPVYSDPDQEVTRATGAINMVIIHDTNTPINLILDYDQLSAKYQIGFNDSDSVGINYFNPPNGGWWIEPLSATFNASYDIKAELSDNGVIKGNNAYAGLGSNSDSIYPTLSFQTQRSYFGDEPDLGTYKAKGSYEGIFGLYGSGSESRTYNYEGYEPINGIYPSTTASFNPTVNRDVIITALTYNGSSINPKISIPTGEMTVHPEASRGIEWEGNSIPFLVARTMYEYDGTPVEVAGQYTRAYQPDNQTYVTISPKTTTFYDDYREVTKAIEGIYINAPYTTNSAAKKELADSGKESLKSGYFYTIHGGYTVVVTTKSYVRVGSDTAHESLVASVIDHFKVVSNIPSVKSAKETSSFLPYYEDGSGNIKVTVSQNTETSSRIIGASEYYDHMEHQSPYKYDEHLSLTATLGDIAYVTETTTISLVLSNATKMYTALNAADGNYYMFGYIEGFTLGDAYIGGSHVGDIEVAELPKGITSISNNTHYFEEDYLYNFIIKGNMYEDTNVSN